MEESFWDLEEAETDDDSYLDEGLIFIPKQTADFIKEVEEAKEQLDYLEILRARQHKQLFKLQDDFKQYAGKALLDDKSRELLLENSLFEAAAVPGKKILKLRMNFLLPIYPKNKNTKFAYYTALQETYQEKIISELITKRDHLPNFEKSEKVFVLIVQYFKNANITDLDNRFHSFIFNALRSARITPDDRWQNLAYMEDGRPADKEPFTEVYVGDYGNFEDIIEVSKHI